MIRAELKAQAKEQLKGNVFKFFLCGLVIFLIGLGCGFVPVVGVIASIVITPAMSLGLIMTYMDASKGIKPEVGTIFKGFNCMGKSLWLTILVAVFTFLWSLLLWIPGFIKAISYSMSMYILAENPEMTAREALRESKAIMHGHKMDYFVMGLSFIPWMLLGTFTLGIAYIYVIPYMQLTIVNFYHAIKRQPAVETEFVQQDMI